MSELTNVVLNCTLCGEPCNGPSTYLDNGRRPFCCVEHLIEGGELVDVTGATFN